MHTHRPPETERLDEPLDARTSEVVLRNHDESRSYVVRLELTVPGGTTAVTSERYRVAAGETRCLSTVAPRGATRITARLQGGDSDTVVGRLSERPGETAVVAVGNGVVRTEHGL